MGGRVFVGFINYCAFPSPSVGEVPVTPQRTLIQADMVTQDMAILFPGSDPVSENLLWSRAAVPAAARAWALPAPELQRPP